MDTGVDAAAETPQRLAAANPLGGPPGVDAAARRPGPAAAGGARERGSPSGPPGTAILARLRAHGLSVALTDAGRIQVRPRERVTREMDRWIRTHRAALVAALRAEQQPHAAEHPRAAGEYTEVPNALLDLWAPQLTEAELRVLLYLIRRTAGFHRQQAAVSIAQLASGMCAKDGRHLDHGTGMNRKSIFRALDRLEARGLVERTRTDHAGDLGGRNLYRVLLDAAGVPSGTS